MTLSEELLSQEQPAAAAAVVQVRRGSALWLRLNRPASLNGLNPDILDGMHRGLDAAATDPDIRSVVVTGEGRAFQTGVDVTESLPRTATGKVMKVKLRERYWRGHDRRIN